MIGGTLQRMKGDLTRGKRHSSSLQHGQNHCFDQWRLVGERTSESACVVVAAPPTSLVKGPPRAASGWGTASSWLDGCAGRWGTPLLRSLFRSSHRVSLIEKFSQKFSQRSSHRSSHKKFSHEVLTRKFSHNFSEKFSEKFVRFGVELLRVPIDYRLSRDGWLPWVAPGHAYMLGGLPLCCTQGLACTGLSCS